MKHSVIISYYKNLDNLKLILLALSHQSDTDFEVIIAEDDQNEVTTTYFKEATYPFHLTHLNQLIDDGFRKNEMLNKSIKIAQGDTIIFIDGDCVPHKHFIKAYTDHASDGYILSGRRVMLGEEISQKILSTKNLKTLTSFSVLRSDSKLKKEALYFPYFSLKTKTRGLLGCNWGIKKTHLLEINGFDEDYIMPGVGEDVDIEWRLMAKNYKLKSMKNKAIVYHMYHPRSYSEDGVKHNYEMMHAKQKQGNASCLNGLEKLKTT